jgi:hypothetical protein
MGIRMAKAGTITSLYFDCSATVQIALSQVLNIGIREIKFDFVACGIRYNQLQLPG